MAVQVLDSAAHGHEAAVGQLELELSPGQLAFLLGSDDEAPGCAERKGRQDRVFAEFGLVVGVHAHGILTVTVTIEQNVIEGYARMSANSLEQVSERGRQRAGLECLPRVSVRYFACPTDQARLHDLATEEDNRALFESHGVERATQQVVRLAGHQKVGLLHDPGAAWQAAVRSRPVRRVEGQ
jgi:hypothetical protein